MKRAILVLSKSGLQLARRLRAEWLEGTSILAPSCIIGACGGPVPEIHDGSAGLPPRVFATAEAGVFGWVGPLRKVLPTLWDESDAIVAVMAVAAVVRLVGGLAAGRRDGPAVVAVDEAGRFAVSVLGGRKADALARDVADALGATVVITADDRA